MHTIFKFPKYQKAMIFIISCSFFYHRLSPDEAAGDGGLRECVPLHRLVVPNRIVY